MEGEAVVAEEGERSLLREVVTPDQRDAHVVAAATVLLSALVTWWAGLRPGLIVLGLFGLVYLAVLLRQLAAKRPARRAAWRAYVHTFGVWQWF
ncbi:hypothetical protein CFP65_0717 [Kitasatospora sp. MMS16-BH015]|uniref:hypothetical protein n=1 Tax=Kitasatospora sp. MMS16-BH015 TaxID=2018025 RepID=UPI000CA2BB96|nr:hypothetical protein [Kitasatospora sp. MMS16-BH015]AUG75668.1 hypothetical protein CFP65_0717 [Kitasatospora sp. MMS16-BH015]